MTLSYQHLERLEEDVARIADKITQPKINKETIIIENDNNTFFYDSNIEMVADTPNTVYLFKTSITRLDYIDNSLDNNDNYPHGVQIYSVDGSLIQKYFKTKHLALDYLNSFL